MSLFQMQMERWETTAFTYLGVRDIIRMPMYFFLVIAFPTKRKTSLDHLLLPKEPQRLLTFWLIISLSKQWSTVPLACLSWDSVRNFLILSDGIANEIPAVTFNVLIPMTSPSWRNKKLLSANVKHLEEKWMISSKQSHTMDSIVGCQFSK